MNFFVGLPRLKLFGKRQWEWRKFLGSESFLHIIHRTYVKTAKEKPAAMRVFSIEEDYAFPYSFANASNAGRERLIISVETQ